MEPEIVVPTTARQQESLRLHVSEDAMRAWFEVSPQAGPSIALPSREELLTQIDRAQIPLTDDVRARVDAMLTDWAVASAPGAHRPGGPDATRTFVIAEGTRPTAAEDGRFEWHPDLQARVELPSEADRVNYFARQGIVTVPKGTHIGRVFAPVPGKSGTDVYGREVQPARADGTPVKLGNGVAESDEESGVLVATVDGRVIESRGQVYIIELLTVPGDVNFRSGSIDVCVDVTVQGTVQANFSVRTTRSLTVKQAIEAARVHADEDITVSGGIFGNGRAGRVEAGRHVSALLINEATVKAGGDLHFRREIINSHVEVGGTLAAPQGTIIGGYVYACQGVEVHAIGNLANVKTRVEIGTSAEALRRLHRIREEVARLDKAVAQLRQKIDPLIANENRLLPAQREHVAEVQRQIEQLGVRKQSLRQEEERLANQGGALTRPCVLVHNAIYPGTTVRIDGLVTRLTAAFRGPVRIELRRTQASADIVAVDAATGRETTLPARDVDPDEIPTAPADP